MAIGEIVEPLFKRKTKDIITRHKLPKCFLDTVGWDMIAICQELEFADLVPPRFFAERAKWYLAGHFPCGWEGDFPVGASSSSSESTGVPSGRAARRTNRLDIKRLGPAWRERERRNAVGGCAMNARRRPLARPAAELLKQLQEANWFASIGRPLDDPHVIRVDKWMAAIASLTDGWWEVCGYERALALRRAAVDGDRELAGAWEQLDEQLVEVVRPLLARQVGPVRAERGFPVEAEMILGHQVRHALLEAQFLGRAAAGFFSEIASWLLRGRLPCGMNQAGKLLVY
jgi:hypothetical protein